MVFHESADLYDLFYEWKDYRREAESVRDLVLRRHARARTLLDVLSGRGLWIGQRSGAVSEG